MIRSLDHLVLTVRDLDATARFYVEGLGMALREFGEGRKALHFGAQKINLHVAGREFEPKAAQPVPGSADLCFLTGQPLAEIGARLEALGHPIIQGPVERSGATGPITSLYTRDPDGNLIEIAQARGAGRTGVRRIGDQVRRARVPFCVAPDAVDPAVTARLVAWPMEHDVEPRANRWGRA